MLIFSRRQGEVIQLDDGVAVTVLEVRGEQIILGIDAPAGTPICWKEEGVREDAGMQTLQATGKSG